MLGLAAELVEKKEMVTVMVMMIVKNRASSLASLVLPWDETVVVVQMVVPCSGVLASCRPQRSYSAMAKERASSSSRRRRRRCKDGLLH